MRLFAAALLFVAPSVAALGQGTPIVTWETQYSGRIVAMEFTPGGDELIVALNDGQGSGSVIVWNTANGAIKNSFGASTDIEAFDLSVDGSWVAIATYDRVRVFQRASGSLITVLPVGARALAFSPDSQSLATTIEGGVTIWDWEQGTHGDVLPVNGPRRLTFSPDGSMLACGTYYGQQDFIRVWSTADWSLRTTVGSVADKALEFSSDSKKLAWAGN